MLLITAPGQGAQAPGFLSAWLELPGFADRLGAWSDLAGCDLIRKAREDATLDRTARKFSSFQSEPFFACDCQKLFRQLRRFTRGAGVDAEPAAALRVEAIETAQAVQEANLAGAQATQAAAQAGMSATGAAMQAGNMAAMVIGSVALVTGLFLGITIAHAKR